MTVYKDYLAGKAAELFLDFHAVRGAGDGQPEDILYRRVVDQEAYDTWHLSWYFNEILELHGLLKGPTPRLADIPRKEKHLLMYLLIEAWNGDGRIDLLEFGCSLFELIDGLQLVDKVLGLRTDLLSRLRFHGVDLSDVMRAGAERLHPDCAIGFSKTLPDVARSFDIVYDRNVSSYALTTPADLIGLMNLGKVSFHNLFVSRGDTFLSMRMGKSITYFGLKELIAGLDRPLFHLFGRSSRGTSAVNFDATLGRDVIEGFFLCADEAFARRWLDAANSRPEVRAWFAEKEIGLTRAENLL